MKRKLMIIVLGLAILAISVINADGQRDSTLEMINAGSINFTEKEWLSIIDSIISNKQLDSAGKINFYKQVNCYTLFPKIVNKRIEYKLILDSNNVFAVNPFNNIILYKYRTLKGYSYERLDIHNYIIGNNFISRPLKEAALRSDSVITIRLLNDAIYPFTQYGIAYFDEVGDIEILNEEEEKSKKILMPHVVESNRKRKILTFSSVSELVKYYYDREGAYLDVVEMLEEK